MSHSGGAGFSQASARRVQSRGWSTYNSFDIKHLWSTGWIYELPFGKGKRFGAGWNPVADKLIGGWQIGGILFFRSGLPFTVSQQTGLLSTGTGNRPDRIGSGTLENPTQIGRASCRERV